MKSTERRLELMWILCRRRYDTLVNLSAEFGVSTRTIQRDIDAISCEIGIPIYTKSGRHGGGIYVLEGFKLDRMYMTEPETSLLLKLQNLTSNSLSEAEKGLLEYIIKTYTKPKIEDFNYDTICHG